jgi:hypothetical protein
MTTAKNDTTHEPRAAVKQWRGKLKNSMATVSEALDGLQRNMVALDRMKAPIDMATLDELNALDERLNTIVGEGRYEGVDYQDGDAAPNIETDAAERAGDKAADDDEPRGALSKRTTYAEQSLIYGIQAIANTMYNEDSTKDIEEGLPIALKHLVDDLAGRL